MTPRQEGSKERIDPVHSGRATEPTYIAMDAERSTAPPQGQHRYLLERTYQCQPMDREGTEPKEYAGLSNDGKW